MGCTSCETGTKIKADDIRVVSNFIGTENQTQLQGVQSKQSKFKPKDAENPRNWANYGIGNVFAPLRHQHHPKGLLLLCYLLLIAGFE